MHIKSSVLRAQNLEHENESLQTPAFDRIRSFFNDVPLDGFVPAYQSAVRALRSSLQYRGAYTRPTKSRTLHPFMQTDFPEIRRDKFEPGAILSKAEFAEAAIARTPPLESADRDAARELPPDLLAAMDFIAESQEDHVQASGPFSSSYVP